MSQQRDGRLPRTAPAAAWSRAASWFGLALAGQAAALQLIDAGPRLRYQHYRLGTSQPADWILWGLLLLQLVLVAAGVRRLLGPIWRVLEAPTWRVGVSLIVLWISSAIISRELWTYPVELTVATLVQLSGLGAVVLAVLAVPVVPKRLAAIGQALCEAHGPGPVERSRARWIWPAAAAVAAVAATLAVFVYQRHPHVPDEVVYLLHARYFADGKLWIPVPPAERAFNLDLLVYEANRAFSPVPPGWPAILALGAAAGVPWLVNPLLAGLNIWLAWRLFSELYEPPVAIAATVLLCVSPWHLFLGMSYMTHTATLTCALLAGYALARARRPPRAVWVIVAGAAAGAVAVIRPLEGLAVAMLLGPLSLTIGERRVNWRPALLFGLSFGAAAAVVLPYNAALTGDPLKFPIMAYLDRYYWPKSNALGFGPERGLGWAIDPQPGHTPLEGAVNTLVNASQVSTELFGWASGSLVGLLALAAVGRVRRVDLVLLSMVVIIVGLHFFYWYTGGPDFGARYWFLALPPLVALTARGIQDTERALARHLGAIAHGRVVLAAALLALIALVTFVPWRATDKYWHFRGMRPDAARIAGDHGFGRSLVIVRGNRHPDYASAAVFNPLDVRGADGPVFAWDRDEAARRAAVEAFPDRPVWVLNGPTLTGRGYEIVERPLPGPSTGVAGAKTAQSPPQRGEQ